MATLSSAAGIAFGLIAVCSISFCLRGVPQAGASQSDSISVSLSMEKGLVAIGKSPVAILTVKNLSKQEEVIHSNMYRVHVEGEAGEPATTQMQRQATGRLRPGEAPLREDENALWEIESGKSGIHKFLLSYFYDLSVPGGYTVYAEVMDPSTQKWMRTNTVDFTMQAPTH